MHTILCERLSTFCAVDSCLMSTVGVPCAVQLLEFAGRQQQSSTSSAQHRDL